MSTQDAGINSACNERVFRIDVGLSKGCGDGDPQVYLDLSATNHPLITITMVICMQVSQVFRGCLVRRAGAGDFE